MNKITWKIFGWLSFLIISVFLTYNKAFAQGVQFDPEGKIKKATKLTDKSPVDVTIVTIQWVLGFLGLIGVVFIIYGGFTWMTAAGNEERVKKAKDIIKVAVIGLMVILLSWAFVLFIIDRTQTFI